LIVDFETRSTSELSECGSYKYAEHSSTDIICMAWALGLDDEPKLWLPFDSFPDELRVALSEKQEVYAHNYLFDRGIWNCVGGVKYGFPEILDSQWRCSMVLAYWMGLPGALEKAAIASGIDAKKDMKASRVMKQISKPRKLDTDGKPIWWDDEKKFQTTYAYCLQDLKVTQQLLKVVLPLQKCELNIFDLDREINDRGVRVDMRSVVKAIAVVEQEKILLDAQMLKVTGGAVSRCSEVGKLTTWVKNQKPEVMGVSKAVIEETLKCSDLPSSCRQALLLRQESAKASTAKLKALQDRAGADNRVRGAFQYSGANTHRWVGRGAQLQNFRRPTLLTNVQIDDAVGVLTSYDNPAEILRTFFGPPMAVLADCIRGFLVPQPGFIFQAGDFSSIEARVLAWLAGEEKILEVFRGHGKIYEATASAIFGVPIDVVTKDQRQIGKTAVLACGYGGGIGAFQKMAMNYGVKVSDERADIIKKRWREANPKIVRYWYNLDNVARAAIKYPGDKFSTGAEGRQVTFLKKGTFLLCRLPSSRIVFYPYPKIEEVETPWGEMKFAVTYKSEDAQTKQWTTQKTFPGFWAENITQAVSRDLLAEAMLRMRNNGESIVMHSHDEIVCETRFEHAQASVLKREMSEIPTWATGLPVEVKIWDGFSYRKE